MTMTKLVAGAVRQRKPAVLAPDFMRNSAVNVMVQQGDEKAALELLKKMGVIRLHYYDDAIKRECSSVG